LSLNHATQAPHPFQSFNVFLGNFAPNTTVNFFPNVAVDAALKKFPVEVDPCQRVSAFVASAVRHVVVVSVRRRFLPWTDAFQPLRELAEARLLGERSGF